MFYSCWTKTYGVNSKLKGFCLQIDFTWDAKTGRYQNADILFKKNVDHVFKKNADRFKINADMFKKNADTFKKNVDMFKKNADFCCLKKTRTAKMAKNESVQIIFGI